MVAPVSVVIPCFQCTETLPRTLESINRQTLKPAEVIVVDDGNPPHLCEKIEAICESEVDLEIRIVHLEQNKGAGYARNAGWQIAKGDYVAFLDADDIWHPQKLEIQYGWLRQRPKIVLAGHQIMEIREGDLLWSKLPAHWRTHRIRPLIQLLSNRFLTSTVMIKRDIPFRFMASKRYSEDYQLWSEIVLSKFPAYRLEVPLAFVYKPFFGASGLSARLYQMEINELATYRYLCRAGLLPTVFFFGLIFLSLAKFMKRIIAVSLRRSPNRGF